MPIIKVFRQTPQVQLPVKKSRLAAGYDVTAYLPDGSVTLEPGGIKLISTGLFFEIPPGYEMQVRPRSGLALKHGITLPNAPGTIDADYRGELGVILANLGPETFVVENGMRIAQLVTAKVEEVSFTESSSLEELTPSDRGEGGFGHTGV